MSRFMLALLIGMTMLASRPAQAWDHPGHMTTAAIAWAEIERTRPDLLDKIGLVLLKHPGLAPFWVAAGDARGLERARRMFIEAARWPDDQKFTTNDRPTYHSARFAIVTDDAPQATREMVAARGGIPVGDALEALTLNAAVMANPEAKPWERALALCWVMHITGDIHQPLHVTDLYSAEYPTGNAAGTLSYVWDPLRDSAIPLHLLWDSNNMRSTDLGEIDAKAKEFIQEYPRSSFPQLAAGSVRPDFEAWARESHQIAVDFAYGSGIKTIPDPNMNVDSERLIGNMVNYILNGVSPVDSAPPVPDEYWQKLLTTAHRQVTLAGYRIADLIIAAADNIFSDRALSGQILDSMQHHGAPK